MAYAKTKEIYDFKQDIIQYLQTVLWEIEHQDPFVKEFSNNLKIAIDEAKGKGANVVYGTEIN